VPAAGPRGARRGSGSAEGVPAGTPGRIALPVAGDDPDARRIAATLTDVTGFDPVDIGGLDNSWRAHPGTAAYCTKLPPGLSWTRSPAPTGRTHPCDATSAGAPSSPSARLHRAITLTPDPA